MIWKMDSQTSDSLDIAKLKCFALSRDENDLSHAGLNEPGSQSSLASSQISQISHRSRVSRRGRRRGSPNKPTIAVEIYRSRKRHGKDSSQGISQSQELLSSVPNSNTPKMSSGENGPGDTQPISQSIYENIIAREKSFQPSQNGGYPRSDAHDADQESLPMTVKEGEPGHIDLLAGFDSKKATVAHNSSDDDELSSKEGPSSPMPLASHEIFPESQRFLETPATSEKQRDTPNLATTTPSLPRNPLAADLGSSGGTMALSLGELFKATQAPSSPFVNGLPSAPLSDRPSPDIPIQTRPLGVYTSSPSRTPRPHLTRTHTDPLSYIPMDESQKLRDKLSEERRTRSAENIDSEERIDTDFEEESSFVQRMNRQRKIANETDARLASVTGGRSPSDLKAKPSVGPINHRSRDGVGYDEQRPITSLNNEGVSEEETEKEDNYEIPASQTRQAVSSSEEDKENQVGPYTTASYTATLAHDRLSQALELHNDSTLTDTPPAELSLLTPQDNIVKMPEQVINVRDSQPSPSQQSSKHARTTSLFSHPESEQIHSSYDELSPPRKRQRQQYTAQLSPNKQLIQRNPQLSSSARSPNQRSRHQPSSKYQIQNTSGTSSLPSLVANTPVNKIGEDTIPETSIPESSPGRIRQATATLDVPSRLSAMQETDEEDPELPTPRHQRQWRNFAGISSQNGTQSRKWSSFVSSSPAKGTIKTLSEISAELSTHVAPDDESWDVQIFSNEDREFSKTIEGPSRTPRKRFRTAGDRVNLQVASSLLAPPESSRSVNTTYIVQAEPQANDPESPGPLFRPVIARRQRGRPTQPKEDMFDMDASPRARTPTTASQMLRTSQLNRPKEKDSKLPSPIISKIPHNRSQHSFAPPINTDSNRVEQTVRDSSVTSNRNLPNTNTQDQNATSDIESPVPEDAMVAPNQVLASWNGRKRAYYPATYLRSCGPKRCLVKFVDSSEPVEVALGSMKKLQLRVGDAIKVDLINIPKVTHIVRGFSHQLKPEDLLKRDDYGNLPVTDVYGFSNVILAAKQRKSLPGGGHLETEETIQVPIYSIYLDMILWNQLKGRPFTPDKKTEPASNVIQTPSRGASTPVSPGSKLLRTHLTLREGIFSGMVFAVSFGDQDVTKARLTRLILENGGQILQDGFEELFEFPSNVPPVTQTTISSQTSSTEESIQFRLAPKYENVGFACLIADRHSRRAKYMQALALNVPCLSRRWIEDCASQNRILGWEHYLLPAGESKYLHGAIKSRVLTPFSAETARFAEMIDGRAKLLDGQSVLLVLGRGKAEERRKAYLFLAYALGATKVGRVLDLKAGKKMLHEHARNDMGRCGWNWLYVDDHEEAAAKEMITGSKPLDVVSGSKKRKRSSIFPKSLAGDETTRDERSLQVMSNESVCQSLILGMICN